jgi:hypothetical protein
VAQPLTHLHEMDTCRELQRGESVAQGYAHTGTSAAKDMPFRLARSSQSRALLAAGEHC